MTPPRPALAFAGLLALLSAASRAADAAPSPAAAAPAEVALPEKFPAMFFDWNQLAVKPTGAGERRDVYDAPTKTLHRFECHITTLNAGLMSHPPHRHPQEELIILKEGTLDVSINGQTQRVGPGSAFFFAAYDLHNVRNVGAAPATYLVFNFASAITRTLPAVPAAEAAKPGQLPSSVWDWEKLPAVPAKYGTRRSLVKSPTITLAQFESHTTTLAPHESSTPTTPWHLDEGFMVAKEGTMEIVLNGVAHRAVPGSIAFLASGEPHFVRNLGDTPATYYVVHFSTEATPKRAAN